MVLKFLVREALVGIQEMRAIQLVMYVVTIIIHIAKAKFNKGVSNTH